MPVLVSVRNTYNDLKNFWSGSVWNYVPNGRQLHQSCACSTIMSCYYYALCTSIFNIYICKSKIGTPLLASRLLH